MRDGHEAQAMAELAHAKQSRTGRFLREIVGWPIASRRLKSKVSLREMRHVGPSHLHAKPNEAEGDLD